MILRRAHPDDPPALFGVVHLLALPGAPGPRPDLRTVAARARADVDAMLAGGVDAVILENFGDAPFAADAVAPATVAAMTAVAGEIRQAFPDLPMGINVLRNDALAALSIAHVVGASFIRVNVLSGVMATDQGLITGRAREVAQLRGLLGADRMAVAADVLVKHATPIGSPVLEDVARDTYARAGADALIVTGSGTGRPTDMSDLDRVRAAVPDAPLWVGSGVDPARAPDLRGRVDAAIVGTWLHRDADLEAPVDADRVRAVRDALGS